MCLHECTYAHHEHEHVCVCVHVCRCACVCACVPVCMRVCMRCKHASVCICALHHADCSMTTTSTSSMRSEASRCTNPSSLETKNNQNRPTHPWACRQIQEREPPQQRNRDHPRVRYPHTVPQAQLPQRREAAHAQQPRVADVDAAAKVQG